MRDQDPDGQGKRGRMLVAGSTASLYAFPNESLYGTAKHGPSLPASFPSLALPYASQVASD